MDGIRFHAAIMTRRLSIAAIILASVVSCIQAEESKGLAIGSKMISFKTTDQHGQPYELKPGPKQVIVSFEMEVAKKTNAQLAKLGQKYLDERKAVYVANIHGMPGIGRMFAMPKMRKYPHRIVLADQKGLLDPLPQKPGQISIFTLDGKGTIKAISYCDPGAQQIDALLK